MTHDREENTYRPEFFKPWRIQELIASDRRIAALSARADSGYAKLMIDDIVDHVIPYTNSSLNITLTSAGEIELPTLAPMFPGARSYRSDLDGSIRELFRRVAYQVLIFEVAQYGLILEWRSSDSQIRRFELGLLGVGNFQFNQRSAKQIVVRNHRDSRSRFYQPWRSRIFTFTLPEEYRRSWKRCLEWLIQVELGMPPFIEKNLGKGQGPPSAFSVADYSRAQDVAIAAGAKDIGWISWVVPPKGTNHFYYCKRRLDFLIFSARLRESLLDEINRCLTENLPNRGFPIVIEGLPGAKDLGHAKAQLRKHGQITNPRIRELLYLPVEAEVNTS